MNTNDLYERLSNPSRDCFESLSPTDQAIINGIIMTQHADAELVTRYGGDRPGKVLQFKKATPEQLQAVATRIAARFHGQIRVVVNAAASEIRLLEGRLAESWKCQECGATFKSPREECPKCGSSDIDLAEAVVTAARIGTGGGDTFCGKTAEGEAVMVRPSRGGGRVRFSVDVGSKRVVSDVSKDLAAEVADKLVVSSPWAMDKKTPAWSTQGESVMGADIDIRPAGANGKMKVVHKGVIIGWVTKHESVFRPHLFSGPDISSIYYSSAELAGLGVLHAWLKKTEKAEATTTNQFKPAAAELLRLSTLTAKSGDGEWHLGYRAFLRAVADGQPSGHLTGLSGERGKGAAQAKKDVLDVAGGMPAKKAPGVVRESRVAETLPRVGDDKPRPGTRGSFPVEPPPKPIPQPKPKKEGCDKMPWQRAKTIATKQGADDPDALAAHIQQKAKGESKMKEAKHSEREVSAKVMANAKVASRGLTQKVSWKMETHLNRSADDLTDKMSASAMFEVESVEEAQAVFSAIKKNLESSGWEHRSWNPPPQIGFNASWRYDARWAKGTASDGGTGAQELHVSFSEYEIRMWSSVYMHANLNEKESKEPEKRCHICDKPIDGKDFDGMCAQCSMDHEDDLAAAKMEGSTLGTLVADRTAKGTVVEDHRLGGDVEPKVGMRVANADSWGHRGFISGKKLSIFGVEWEVHLDTGGTGLFKGQLSKNKDAALGTSHGWYVESITEDKRPSNDVESVKKDLAKLGFKVADAKTDDRSITVSGRMAPSPSDRWLKVQMDNMWGGEYKIAYAKDSVTLTIKSEYNPRSSVHNPTLQSDSTKRSPLDVVVERCAKGEVQQDK